MADSGPPSRRTPGPLDRAALERVLARAAELQASISAETPAQITEEELLAIGKEVGLSVDHMRQALAEERTRVTLIEESGLVPRYFGPSQAIASRIVPGSPDEVLAIIDRWLTREQTLTMKRRFPDRMTWETKRGLEGAIRRLLAGQEIMLVTATEVGASVTPMETGRTLVRLDATLIERRRQMVGWSVATASGMALTGAAVASVGILFFPVAVAFVGLGAGALMTGGGIATAAAIAGRQKRVLERVQLALEQMLDRLEAGERPSQSLLSVFSQAARQLK